MFDPLGMTRSSACYYEPIIKGRAQGYAVAGGAFRNSEFMTLHTPGAAGVLCSSVVDLVTWTRALHGGKVVSPESHRRMITPGRLNDGSATISILTNTEVRPTDLEKAIAQAALGPHTR